MLLPLLELKNGLDVLSTWAHDRAGVVHVCFVQCEAHYFIVTCGRINCFSALHLGMRTCILEQVL